MNVLCVDDEILALSILTSYCRKCEKINTFKDFSDSVEALEYAKVNRVDVAFIDIDMPKMNGLELLGELKKTNAEMNIIFTTAYSQFALDAYSGDASGYLLKPFSYSQFIHQLDVLRYPVPADMVTIKCFGNFDVSYNGKSLDFSYKKTKELIAYLIDKEGALCSNNEIIVNLWEDDEDHTAYLRKLKKDFTDVLERIGKGDIITVTRGEIGIRKDKVSCDYFDYLENKNKDYKGFYMEQYSWAELTKAALDNKERD